MKRHILATMTVAAGLLASASLANADSFLELVSGTSSVTVTGAGTQSVDVINQTVGAWNQLNLTIGTAAQATLHIDLGSTDQGSPVTASTPLTIIYSTGDYFPDIEGWQTSGYITVDQFRGTVTVKYYDTPGLYTGSGPLPAPFDTMALTGVTVNHNGGPINLAYYTEVVTISPSARQTATISLDTTFTSPDGGLTVALLGSALVGLAGFRSMFGKRG